MKKPVTTPETRGGSRPNAGAPTIHGTRLKWRNIGLTPDLWTRIETASQAAQSRSVSDFIAEAIAPVLPIVSSKKKKL